jgi:hypothetical protein
MTLPKRILVLTVGVAELQAIEPDYVKMLRGKGHEVELRKIIEATSVSHILQAFRLSQDIAKFDMVIAQEYFSTFGLCVRSVIAGCQTKLAAIGFNVSRRYLRTPVGFINKAINQLFGRLSLVVVHSQSERILFSRIHKLDDRRIAVALWGFDLPRTYNQDDVDRSQTRPYVCMVGRNNRDFATLERAISGTSIQAIFVTSRSSKEVSVHNTDQIEVLYDISMEECLRIMDLAAVNVILLKDEQRGAGHITAVSAMLLGKAHVFSRAGVLTDYLVPDRHGLAVPIGNEREVRGAVLRLCGDHQLAKKFGEEAKSYARTFLTNHSFQLRLFQLLDRLLESLPIDILDEHWREYRRLWHEP